MIDIKIIKEAPEKVIEGLAKKGKDAEKDIYRVIELDAQRRDLIAKSESMKAEQNKTSKLVPQYKKEGKDVQVLFAEMKELSAKVKEYEDELAKVEAEYTSIMLSFPNLPDPDLVGGGKENNQPLYYVGEHRKFDFEPKNHVDLCTNLGMIDYKRGVKLSGNGFWIYKGMGARLEWALLNYFIDTHIKNGFELVLVPHMLGYECGLTAGQFPKFKDEVYWLQTAEDERERFMLPTAETALVSLHRDEILKESDLPRKYISYTPCFRREAGSYRADERGMVRGHQFNKVEMVQYTTPEGSDAAFEELVAEAELLVKGLGLHFRTVKLAAGDCSASMARTYDIEINIPSMDGYKEVSSVSNARDYQARRGQIRFKREDGKVEYCHTLNGSGLATSRILPAIVEQNQNADGSVNVPDVLVKYVGTSIIK
ncbi:MAG: serine--tRNA ligase [Clostridiales bacterium]|nr:serine--tRNA ligase [Clostridiales bacterium]